MEKGILTALSLLLLSLVYAQSHLTKPEIVIPFGHQQPVISLDYSPDGKYVISGSMDQKMKLWDIKSEKEIRTYEGNNGSVYAVSFSPDGKFLYSYSSYDNSMRTRGLSSENNLKTYTILNNYNVIPSFPDRKIFLAVYSKLQEYTYKNLTDVPPDDFSKYLNSVSLLDCESGKITEPFKTKSNFEVNASAFSPDGKIIALAYGGINSEIEGQGFKGFEIELRNASSGKRIKFLKGHKHEVHMILFTPDGKYLLSCSSDKTIKIWDTQTGTALKTLVGTDEIFNIAISPDGKYLISASIDKSITQWDFETAEKIRTIKNLPDKVYSLAFHPTTPEFAAGLGTGEIFQWNAVTGLESAHFSNQADWIQTAILSDDMKKLIMGSKTNKIKVLDISGRDRLKELKGHADITLKLYKSPDKKHFFSASQDSSVTLWDINSLNELRSYQFHPAATKHISFSHDGTKAISLGNFTYDNDSIYLWNTFDGKIINAFEKPFSSADVIALSPDGTFFLITINANIELRDTKSGKLIKTFKGHTNTIGKLSFSPNHKEFASVSTDNEIKFWDIDSGKLLKSYNFREDNILSAAFSLDWKYMAFGTDFSNNVKLRDIETGKEIHTFKGHSNTVNSVAFSADGKFIISTSYDNVVKIWSHENLEESATIYSLYPNDWVVKTPSGLFDASEGAMSKLYYVAGTDFIELKQLKDRYYEPGLLRKILKGEVLRDVQGFNTIQLPPEINMSPVQNGKTKLKIINKLEGGIGKVPVYINGKEIIADARMYASDFKSERDIADIQYKDSLSISIDLSSFTDFFVPNVENIISVKAYNAENFIISRPVSITYTAQEQGNYNKKLIPEVYILSVGTSEYYNSDLNLSFAAKDADDMATALQIAAQRLFGEDKVHSYLFTSPLSNNMNMINGKVTVENFEKVFEEISYSISAKDIVIVYLAGHGMNIDTEGNGGDFYYLTQEAHSNDMSAYYDNEIREKTCIAGSDIIQLMNKLPANKQVLILDACHSGKAVENLTLERDMSSGTIRALDRMRDKTGMHIITGSTADAVSYESNQFGQGLLTYSLLEGLKGASLKEDRFVDVIFWFQRAKERVPTLASYLGGIQDPVIFSPYVEGKFKEGAESFEIGELNEHDKEKIPLAKSKTIFVYSVVQDGNTFDDHLKLSKQLDEKFREISSQGSDAPLILIETRDFPGARKLRGQYQLNGGKLILKVNEFKDKKILNSYEFKGNITELDAIINKLTEEIIYSLGEN